MSFQGKEVETPFYLFDTLILLNLVAVPVVVANCLDAVRMRIEVRREGSLFLQQLYDDVVGLKAKNVPAIFIPPAGSHI
jgi:hypothetical protein